MYKYAITLLKIYAAAISGYIGDPKVKIFNSLLILSGGKLHYKAGAVAGAIIFPAPRTDFFAEYLCRGERSQRKYPYVLLATEDLMIIMGIDPGFAITGYGIVKYEGNKFSVIDYGAVTTEASEPFPKRLLLLHEGLQDLIEKHKPDAIAVEELFFNKNIKTALNVGHGRGVALLAGAKAGIEVFEYTPLQVKQSVVGYGRAEKTQIQQMIKVILNLPKVPKPDDVADALAIAVCHGHSYRMNTLQTGQWTGR